ncbi:MAG: hypothetical protein ACRDQX_15790 [Pseudonocardiaceae bacterium]
MLIANPRGVGAARDWLRCARTRTGQLVVSVVPYAEIVGGMRSPERREVARLLNSVRPLPVTDMIAHRAGGLRRPGTALLTRVSPRARHRKSVGGCW